MITLRKTQSVLLLAIATLGTHALHAQTSQSQTTTTTSVSTSATDAGQTAAAAYAAGRSSVPDPRTPPSSRPGALTLAQILDLARSKNPALLAAQQSLQAVRAQEIQAGVRANPYFTFAGTNITLPAEGASNPYAYSAQV